MIPVVKRLASGALVVGLFIASGAATAETDPGLTPARPGWPIAHPIAAGPIAPPPFSLPAERGVRPAYVPGLPGLPQGRAVSDDFGRKPLKYDGVFIRQSRVENGEVVIPPGGLAYLEDTWGGEVALRGEKVPVLSRLPVYVDYDMTIEVQRDVTLPAGGAVVVGGQVYHYAATVGHESMFNHSVQVRTIAGTDWEWAFGAPQFSAGETGWWGNSFAQLYNQGQAREISPRQIRFDWLSGVRMDRLLFAEETVFSGLAGAGSSWTVGPRELRVASVDSTAGTVTLEVRQDGRAVATKTLGPVQKERLIEDTAARKALVFEDGEMVAILSPWPSAFEGDRANLKVYGKAFSLAYGSDYAPDPRFAVYPVGCPTGHNFGFLLVNKQEIRLKPGSVAEGPEGYFKVVVEGVENGQVSAWRIEDRLGNRSMNLGGANVTNIDLVLGQGRVAGQAILKDVGRPMLARLYEQAAGAPQSGPAASAAISPSPAPSSAPSPAPPSAVSAAHPVEAGFSPALMIAVGVAAIGAGAVGFEIGRRRG